MVEQIVALCRQLGAGEEQESLLLPAARSAYEDLKHRLRPGVTVEDCGQAFPLAAAMLAMEHVKVMSGEGNVTSFTAGEVSIRREGAASFGAVGMRLLLPWLKDSGFCVQGVRG